MVGVKHFVLPPKLLRFLIGRKHAMCHGSKLTNSLEKGQGEHLSIRQVVNSNTEFRSQQVCVPAVVKEFFFAVCSIFELGMKQNT